jgi:AAA15 family ATPase/GTPase
MEKSQYIKIKNFRCFKELEVNGFKRVNLIGGKNNAGKTSLLEALLLYFYPVLQGIMELKNIRKGSLETSQKSPRDAWKDFFYNQNVESPISIDGYFDGYFEDFDEQKQPVKILVSQSPQINIFDDDKNYINENAKQFINALKNRTVSTLEIQQIINNNEALKGGVVIYKNGYISNLDDELSIPFINSNFPISSEELAKKYDKIDYEMQGDKILNILKILDSSIIGIKTYSFIEPTLYIKTKNQPQGLPIYLFGDAIYRVITMLVELLDSEKNLLFIDEIENGIHYTNQQTFWQGLFTLAEELDTLIFATTHSLEMIKAFAEAGKNFPNEGAYFELAYSPRTDNIVAINRDIDLLEYDLEHGKAIRGE